MTQQAKDHGSSDNITIVVFFLRPVQELKELYETKYSKQQGDPDSEEEELLYKVGPQRNAHQSSISAEIPYYNYRIDLLTFSQNRFVSLHFRA